MAEKYCWTTLFLYMALSFAVISCEYAKEQLDSVRYDLSEESDDFIRVKRQNVESPTDSPATSTVVSIVKEDTTNYYDIKYIGAEDGGAGLWMDLTAGSSGVVKHRSLQSAYRLAVKIDIGFSFLFYGHSVKEVTIATGGFLYMSEFLHSFLTASQYIAPLMANFDTSLGGNDSEILFRTDDTAFVAQWSNIFLKDKPELGNFTFQVQLHRTDGKIVAVYKQIPVPISEVTSKDHPVKIGLSDAYYWDVGQYRTIYPYHTYRASEDQVKPGAAIVYTHRKTCNMLKDCDVCLNDPPANFQCYWCSRLNRCSDAFDRQRQDWLTSGCVFNVTQTDCSMMFTIAPSSTPVVVRAQETKSTGSSAWKGITAALCTIFVLTSAGILGAILYGYSNPTSPIGQFLVRNRPSELWRKFKAWKDKDEESSTHRNPI
ncbi:plexin domain-containing protein 1-like [Watersipora subatra]|uniref:plexin domain-containing protein 1-like n=1 Tax=Watersipora subatra TaxID=2589382 RepID=UPI00355C8193